MRVRKDGTRFPVSLSIAPILEEDRAVVGASAFGHDMTEQQEAWASMGVSGQVTTLKCDYRVCDGYRRAGGTCRLKT
jgi:hypothetical protein